MTQYAIEADPGKLTASFPIYDSAEEVERVLTFAPFYGKPLPRVLNRPDGGTADDWEPAIMCEDGVDACTGVPTDCCEQTQPSCVTNAQYDTNGDLLVIACVAGFGCQAPGWSPPS